MFFAFIGLAVVTLLYILVSLALTGMVSYTDLAQAENPTLTTAFEAVGDTTAAKVIAFGSLVGLTTVIMVLLMGLSRVVLAMSRDGLLPRALSKTSEKRSTPARLQVMCGAAVALVAGLTNVDLLEEMITAPLPPQRAFHRGQGGSQRVCGRDPFQGNRR